MEVQSQLGKLKCFSFIQKQEENKFKDLKRLEELEVPDRSNLKLRLSLALVLQDLDKRKIPFTNLSDKTVYVSEDSQCFIKQSDFLKSQNNDLNEQSKIFLDQFKSILKNNFHTTKYDNFNSFHEIIFKTDDRQENRQQLMNYLFDYHGITDPKQIHQRDDITIYVVNRKLISTQMQNYISQNYKCDELAIKIRKLAPNNLLESYFYEQLNDQDNVCKLICYIRTNQFEILFLEYYQLTLDKYLIQNKPEIFDKDLLKQILQTVKIMHERQLLHRDIKYQNILVTNSGQNPIIKFIDFDVSQRQNIELKPFADVNQNQLPPQDRQQFKYEKEDDIWQIVKMVLEYQVQRLDQPNFERIPPINLNFDGIDYQMKLFEYIDKLRKNNHNQYRQLIYQGLQFCKDARPTIDEINDLIK
ncbi:hypothetical protein pb186bvf_016814 [Paramecium bursaria]